MELPVAKVGRALLARLLFAIHGLLVIWRVSATYNDRIYYLFAIFLVALFIEGGLIIYQRNGNETTWFCSSVFLYLCSVVPPIWFLQLHLCRRAIKSMLIQNGTMLEPDKELAVFEFSRHYKIAVFIPLNLEVWVQLLQQTMMVVVILGRWILPKGDISRDHLSQILLVFLGMAADMVELFDTFKESQVKPNQHLTELVLAVWSVSLIQFPLVLTGRSTKSRRSGYIRKYFRASLRYQRGSKEYHIKEPMPSRFFVVLLTNDINFWAVITGIFLQDAPFLSIRLYLLLAYTTVPSYMMIFFTTKNMLVLLLQSYRLYVICLETYKKVQQAKKQFERDRKSPKKVKRGGRQRCKSAPALKPILEELRVVKSELGLTLCDKDNGKEYVESVHSNVKIDTTNMFKLPPRESYDEAFDVDLLTD